MRKPIKLIITLSNWLCFGRLKGKVGDFSSAEFQNQTDGALFYKVTTGRDDMPAFDKKIPDAEDRWLIINYVRTLKQ